MCSVIQTVRNVENSHVTWIFSDQFIDINARNQCILVVDVLFIDLIHRFADSSFVYLIPDIFVSITQSVLLVAVKIAKLLIIEYSLR